MYLKYRNKSIRPSAAASFDVVAADAVLYAGVGTSKAVVRRRDAFGRMKNFSVETVSLQKTKNTYISECSIICQCTLNMPYRTFQCFYG